MRPVQANEGGPGEVLYSATPSVLVEEGTEHRVKSAPSSAITGDSTTSACIGQRAERDTNLLMSDRRPTLL
jgi:hypothetical protein